MALHRIGVDARAEGQRLRAADLDDGAVEVFQPGVGQCSSDMTTARQATFRSTMSSA